MDNSPCVNCPDRESCDKDKCCKYQAYLAKEARQNADKAWFQELSRQLRVPMKERIKEGKPFAWRKGG